MNTYIWFRKYRVAINGVLITIFTSLILNRISEIQGSVFSDFKSVLTQILEFKSLSGFLTILSFAAFIIFNVLLLLGMHLVNRKSLSVSFSELMLKYTCPNLAGSVGNGCLSWGEGKTAFCGAERPLMR